MNGILSLVGGTPLIRLRRVVEGLPAQVEVYAKAEWFNPGGSVKDRPALRMVMDGIRAGRLKRGMRILDATSGNTGIAYAWIGAALGYGVTLCLPSNASRERKRILTVHGVDIVETDPLEGTDGAQRRAKEMAHSEPERYFYPDQYNNEANWRAHYDGTGREIWEQTSGRVTHLVAGVGTGGTLMGTGRRLRRFNPEVKILEVQPASPFHGLEGLKHMETSLVPGIYDGRFADERFHVETEDAQRMSVRLVREEGLLAGVSSGAACHAALRVCERLERGVVVVIFPDGGDRYLGESFWEVVG